MNSVSMSAKTPKDIAEKWSRNLRQSLEFIRRGVEATTVAPSEKAIAAKDRLRARWIAAIDAGKWEAGLRGYTLDKWKRDMIDKGLPRIADGAEKARPKVEEFMSQLLPYIDAGVGKIRAMPKVTLEDSIARVREWITYMSKFRKK